MKTEVLKVDPVYPEQEDISAAARVLAGGGLVIIPTDTVYGIAANMRDNSAVERLIKIKQRSNDKPFSLLIDKKETVEFYAADIPIAGYKLMDKFWPGPLTLILNSNDKGSIGMRLPASLVAVKIISGSGVPVICPSANLAGKDAPADCESALKDLDGLVDLAVDSGPITGGVESSVVDLTCQPLKIVRETAIKESQIKKTAAAKIVLFVCTGNSCRSVMAQAQLKKRLKESGRSDVEVISAGIMSMGGGSATEATKQILLRDGMDVSGHCSQRVTREMLKKSDIILAMERLQEQSILEILPGLKNRVFLLKEFAKIKDNNLDIDDPIGKSMDFYEDTFRVIKESVEKVLEII